MERRSLANILIGAVVLGALAVAVSALLSTGKPDTGTGRRYVEQARAAAPPTVRLGWIEGEPLALALEVPRALACDAKGSIYAVGRRLQVLDGKGRELFLSGELPGVAYGVAVDEKDRVHISFRHHLRSYALGTEGLELQSDVAVGEPGTWLTAVAVTTHGVFAADKGLARVLAIHPGATPAFKVFASGLVVPSELEIAAGPEGELMTVDPGRHRVQLRDAYGDVVREWGKEGEALEDFHGCCNPMALALLPGDRVATAEKGLGTTRIKVYAPSGAMNSVVAGPEAFDLPADGPLVLDLSVDPQGRILALDPVRRQVRIFTPKED